MADPNIPEAGKPASTPTPQPDMYGATRADAPGKTPAASTPAPELGRYGQTTADAGAATPAGSSRGAAANPYRIITLIGEGGMGRVFLAHDSSLDRLVALKRIGSEHVANERLRQRFFTEARASSRLTHYHIVQVFRLDEDHEGPFIAMEFVPGPLPPRRPDWPADAPNPPLDLDEWVKLHGPLPIEATVGLGRRLLSAVGYAHRNRVIHRDIKPANILLTAMSEPKLADFGLARQVDGADEGRTFAGAQLLTLGYGAPEQEIDASRADHRADLYAVAATLWFALTGHNPRFFRESEVPLVLRPVLMRGLEKDREKRFQDAVEFDQALEHAMGRPQPPVAKPAAPAAPQVAPQAMTGKCPACGHVHHSATQALAALKFCEQCGTSLVEPCLRCTHVNGIWAKYCGSCGVDIAAHIQEVIQEKTAQIQEAQMLASKGEFPKALHLLERLAAFKHPRLTAVAADVPVVLRKTRDDYAAAEKDRDEKLERARGILAAGMLDDADALLDRVPAAIRTPEFVGTLNNVRTRVNIRDALRREIAGRMRDEKFQGLITQVDRIIELDPHDSYYRQLRAIVQDSALKQMERAWRLTRDDGSSVAYGLFIDSFPDSPHVAEAGERLTATVREELLAAPSRKDLRVQYLALRSKAQRRRDVMRALVGVTAMLALLGCIGGGLLGATFNAVGAPSAIWDSLKKVMEKSTKKGNEGTKDKGPMVVLEPPGVLINEFDEKKNDGGLNKKNDEVKNRTGMTWPPMLLGTSLIAGAIAGAVLGLTRSARRAGSGCLIGSCCVMVACCLLASIFKTTPGPAGVMQLFSGAALGLAPGGLFAVLCGLLVGAPIEKAGQFGPLPWHRYGTPLATLRHKYLTQK